MQLTPRYGTSPVITLDGSPADIVAPAIRQRRRLANALAGFTDEQWTHPSRCEGWTTRDVVLHVDSVNSFWAFSIAQGLRGEPTCFLATFDPVASPAELVAAGASVSTDEVLARFTASTDALISVWDSLDDAGWSALAEAPPGHISISALTHHALWDSWVHERDILLPMGVAADEEDDEIAAGLRYVAGLGPALAMNQGLAERGRLAISADGLAFERLEVSVEISECVRVRSGIADADLHLTGDAVQLLEALSLRRPLEQPIPVESAWMLRGLSEIFDVAEQ
jgi:uncharacterized protein (TIGR03083 family)